MSRLTYKACGQKHVVYTEVATVNEKPQQAVRQLSLKEGMNPSIVTNYQTILVSN